MQKFSCWQKQRDQKAALGFFNNGLFSGEIIVPLSNKVTQRFKMHPGTTFDPPIYFSTILTTIEY